jgi:hypothetical protein
MMADIFNEVDADLQRERVLSLWRRWWPFLAGLCVGILLAAALWSWWQGHHRQQAEAAGGRLETVRRLSTAGQDQEARALLETMSTKDPAGYAVLARFRLAALTAKTDRDQAVRLYDALGADAGVEDGLRQLARLRAALLLSDQPDPQPALTRLEALAAPQGLYHASAREILGVLALKRGDDKEAGRWLDLIMSDPSSPGAVRQRAEALSGLVVSGMMPTSEADKASPSPAQNPATPSPDPAQR